MSERTDAPPTLEQINSIRVQLDRDIQVLSATLSQLKENGDHLSENIVSLENLKELPEGSQVMVPLSTSMFIKAKLKDNKNVMLDIGTGYYVDKSIDDAEDYFRRKIKTIQEQMSTIDNGLENKKRQFQNITLALQQQSQTEH